MKSTHKSLSSSSLSSKFDINNLIKEKTFITCINCKTYIPIITLSRNKDFLLLESKCFKCNETLSMDLSEYLSLIKQKEPLHYCTIKKSHSNSTSINYCIDCSNWLCTDCLEDHLIYPSLKRDLIITKQLLLSRSCTKHSDNKLKFYCKDCSVSICKKCLNNLHSNHSLIEYQALINNIIDKNANEILEAFDDIVDDNKKIKTNLINTLDHEIEYLVKIKSTMEAAYDANIKHNNDLRELFIIAYYNFEQLRQVPVYETYANLLNNFNINSMKFKLEDNSISNCLNFIDYLNNNYIVKFPNEVKCVETISGHEDVILCLIQIDDGRLASGSKDRTIKIWNVHQAKCNETLLGHKDPIYSLVQLKDKRLISGSFQEIKVWYISESKCISTLSQHTSSIFALMQYKDNILISGAGDSTIRLWDISSLNCTHVLMEHTSNVYCLIELQDKRIASGAWDNTIKLWNIQSLNCEGTLKGHNSHVDVILQLKDGRLISGSKDKTIRIWDVNSLMQVNILEGSQFIIFALLQLSDDVVLSGDITLSMWDIKNTKKMIKQVKHASNIRRLILLKDGRVASCSDDMLIKLWDF